MDKQTSLPPDVTVEDTKWPSYEESRVPWRVGEYQDAPLELVFYRVPNGKKAPEWVLTTLHISNPSSRQRSRAPDTAARTYAIGLKDEKVYTAGRGPHVTDVVTVYLTAGNVARLDKYIKLWTKGMADASAIRDRISSRRAQGQLYRQQGRQSWMW